MMRAALLHLMCICVALPAIGQEVYRCTSHGETTYQDTRCASGQRETPLAVGARAHVPSISNAQPCTSTPGGRASLPFRRTVLCLGMSDDEVLNLPTWGRPTRITRTKANRVWQERWEYRSHFEPPRQLHFVNGKLANVDAEPVGAVGFAVN
jgi:Domain of unknown function (DUF4124)